MKVFELTSGFIAAVLVALGAYQYVNHTKVEKEPVVKETANKVFAERWFALDISGAVNPNSPTLSEQKITDEIPGDTPQSPCDDDEGTMCAVKLTYELTPEIQALIDRIGTLPEPTVADFDAEGADVEDHSYNNESSR